MASLLSNITNTTTPAASTPPSNTTTITTESDTTAIIVNTTITASTKTATTTTASPGDSDGGDKVLIGVIAGGAAGFIILVIVIVIVIVCIRRYRAEKDDDDDDTPPPPLPKLNPSGRTIQNGTDSDDSAIHHPSSGIPGDDVHVAIVYEDPDKPSTQARILDSDKNPYYGNISVKSDSSAGAYVVPLSYRPSGGSSTSNPDTGGGLRNSGFDWKRDDCNTQGGEKLYMPMDMCNPFDQSSGKSKGVGGTHKGWDHSRPSPCTPKKNHGYVNTPSGKSSPAQISKGYQNHQAEDDEDHYYGNMDSPDSAHKTSHSILGYAASSNKAFHSPSSSPQVSENGGRHTPRGKRAEPQPTPSPKPMLRVKPIPSPKPSPKQQHETSFNHFSPAPSPKVQPKVALMPPAKVFLSAGSPKPLPKPLSKPTQLPPSRVRKDSDSDGEDYQNLTAEEPEEPEDDYINAPERQNDYINAPKKKSL
ncbi:hypothetical protein ACOMHN_001792 [Nucella lapillus]